MSVASQTEPSSMSNRIFIAEINRSFMKAVEAIQRNWEHKDEQKLNFF